LNTSKAKDKIRKDLAVLKNAYTQQNLLKMSEEVFSVLEITGIFSEASHICIYNSMRDEVHTHEFIKKWMPEKVFYLPAIVNNTIVLRKIDTNTVFEKSSIGVDEPIGENFMNYAKIDLAIVPGLAFDRKGNRLGRGKGYYDQFLPKIKAPKIGVCFDFQLIDQVPIDEWDVKMDMLVSENDLIW
jgi:5-formyltetrahydrofolate cyclo-ligase